MKKVMVLAVLFLSAAAFTAGISTESADTVANGKIKAVLGGNMGLFNRYYNNDGNFVEFSGSVARTNITIPVNITMGLAQNVDAGFELPFVLSSHTLASGTKLTGNGFGDLKVFGKMGLMKDASTAVALKISAGLPIGKSVFTADTADLPTSSGFMQIALSAVASMKLMEGNDLSVNAGYSLPLSVTTTKVGGITLPELKITQAGTIFYGIMDKSKLMKEMNLILEVCGYLKGDGSAVFSAGGDASGAVILAAAPEVVLNKRSAVFVKPAVEYIFSDTLSVTAGVSVATSLVNDYSALPGDIFVTVCAGF